MIQKYYSQQTNLNTPFIKDKFVDINFFWNFAMPCIFTSDVKLILNQTYKPLIVVHLIPEKKLICIVSENVCCIFQLSKNISDLMFLSEMSKSTFFPIDKKDKDFLINKIKIKAHQFPDEDFVDEIFDGAQNILSFFNQNNNNEIDSSNSIDDPFTLANFICISKDSTTIFYIYRHFFHRSPIFKKSFFHSDAFQNTFQEFSKQEFIYIKTIGCGASSKNSLYVHSKTGDFFSIKTFASNRPNSYQRELDTFKKVNHRCILKCYGYIKQERVGGQKNALVVDFMCNKSLRDYISKCQNENKLNLLSNTEKTKILLQIFFGLDHLHSLGIFHRDIKIDNILINENGDAVLSDFDLSRVYEGFKSYTTDVGSPLYMSPEQLTNDKISFQTDLYSFALIIYQIATFKSPYEGLKYIQIIDQIEQGNAPHLPSSYGKICEIYKMCTSLNIEQRVGSFYIIRQMVERKLYFANTDENYINQKVVSKCKIRKGNRKDVQFIIDFAEEGSPTSQFYLGLIYLDGHMLGYNYDKAVELFEKAAEKGHAYAAYNLGVLFEKKGQIDKAIMYYKKSIHEKIPNALFSLSQIVQDHVEAFNYLVQASELNFPKALFALGIYYSHAKKINVIRSQSQKQISHYVANNGRSDDKQESENDQAGTKQSADDHFILMQEESKDTGNKEGLNREDENKEDENKENENKVAESKESESKESESKEDENKESENKESESKESENKESENKESESKESENKESENKESENKESENKESENKESESKEDENKESENKESENKESEIKKSENKESENKVAENKEDENKVAENKEDENKVAENKENENKVAENKEDENKVAENKENENKVAENKESVSIELPNNEAFNIYDSSESSSAQPADELFNEQPPKLGRPHQYSIPNRSNSEMYIRNLKPATKNNYKKAFECFVKAANLGYAKAQEKVGEYYMRGKGVGIDHHKAFEFFQKAADQGNEMAQYHLGICYKDGLGCKPSISAACRYFEESSKKGNSNAAYNLGLIYSTSGKKNESFPFLKYAAENGHAIAQYMVGILYEKGVGTEIDLKKAKEFLMMSAYNNNDQGQLCLGRFYKRHFPRDKKKMKIAFELFTKSANQGNNQAFFELALCYESKGDYQEMFKYLKKASNSNNPAAQFRLACFYFQGRFIEKNEKKAFELFNLSSFHGVPETFFYLGICYEFGKGTGKDLKKALNYYRKCAELQIKTSFDANIKLGNWYEYGKNEISIIKDDEIALKFYKNASQIFDAASKTKIDFKNESLFYILHLDPQLIDNFIDQIEIENDPFISFPMLYLLIGEYLLSTKDDERCIKFLMKASSHKIIKSYYIIGELYEKGKFTLNQNIEMSINFYKEAASFGMKEAIKKLENFHKNKKKSKICDQNLSEKFCINKIQENMIDTNSQHRVFQCMTCSILRPTYICCYCAMNCHADHDIIDNGKILHFQCECQCNH